MTNSKKVASATGWLFIAFGALVMLYPFVSVHRIANRSLDELPRIEGVETTDISNRAFAIIDSDFGLATRTYEGADLASVEAALFGSGFTVMHGTTPSQNGFGLDCCGEYDAIWVHLAEVEGDVVASTTAADSDVLFFWPIALFFGSPIVLIGVMLMRLLRWGHESTDSERDLELAL